MVDATGELRRAGAPGPTAELPLGAANPAHTRVPGAESIHADLESEDPPDLTRSFPFGADSLHLISLIAAVIGALSLLFGMIAFVAGRRKSPLYAPEGMKTARNCCRDSDERDGPP